MVSTSIQTISLLIIFTHTVTFLELWIALNFLVTEAPVNRRVCVGRFLVVVFLLSFVDLYGIMALQLHLVQVLKRQHCNLRTSKTSEKLLKERFSGFFKV